MLNLYKFEGDFIDKVVSWESFSDENIKIWVKHFNADYAVIEEQLSIV